MERFVFDPRTPGRLGTVTAIAIGVAIYFFGAPMITLIIGVIPGTALLKARAWYYKHRPHGKEVSRSTS
jgi:hypothetical protein